MPSFLRISTSGYIHLSLFLDMYATVKTIPTRLQPIDSPTKSPLLKLPKSLVSFLLKHI
ncbi:MAG: hypothetical protein PUA73_00785 [Bacilli bacterium]|nr:hypothetical protein [Bacilli bacterium]